ncbi:MAG: amidohydrolase family protein [Opitutaceae bacterium]
MNTQKFVSRRAALKGIGAVGAAVAALGQTTSRADAAVPGLRPAPSAAEARKLISERVLQTPLIDTHEHLLEEKERLQGVSPPWVPCDDWALLFSHYLDSDFLTAGMPRADLDRFLSPKVDPLAKWQLIAPYWPAVRNTGYAQAVRISIQELYAVEDLTERNIAAVQSGYEQTRRPGFYQQILQDRAKIESCQINRLLDEPFKQSDMPSLLMYDLGIVGMFAGPNFNQYAPPTGIVVKTLADWHHVINWWFDRYAKYAVAVKSQDAYRRDIDYARVPAEEAEPVFRKVLQKEPVTNDERKRMEDHLFWYAVDRATVHHLPVKLHTGYYAGQNSMPLSRLRLNAGSAAELCRSAPDTQFVFMHICYPYYEELLSVAKHWSNAHVDMCWSWIINPVAAKDYLKKHIVTAPINKLLPFGGDYIPVEPVLGHAALARRGIALALSELVEEGWLKLADALDLVDLIMHDNARRIFRLAQKTGALPRGSEIGNGAAAG